MELADSVLNALMSHRLMGLAVRVEARDVAAEKQFRLELQTNLRPMVRRALRVGPTQPPDLEILERARWLGWEEGHDPHVFAPLVARSLCDSVVDRVKAGRWTGRAMRETVRMAAAAS